jgi:hypothetical protein
MPARAPPSANRCNPLHVAIGNNRAIAPRKSEAGRVQPAFMISTLLPAGDRAAGAARPGPRPAGHQGRPAARCRRAAVPPPAVTVARRPPATRPPGPPPGQNREFWQFRAVAGVGSGAGLGEAGRAAGVRQAGRAGTGGPTGPRPPRGSPPGPGTPEPGAAGPPTASMIRWRRAGPREIPLTCAALEGGRAPRFSNGHLTGAICGSPCTRTPRCNSVTQPICLLAHRWRSYRSPATG